MPKLNIRPGWAVRMLGMNGRDLVIKVEPLFGSEDQITSSPRRSIANRCRQAIRRNRVFEEMIHFIC